MSQVKPPRHDIFTDRPDLKEIVNKLHAISIFQAKNYESKTSTSIYPKGVEKDDLAPFVDKLVALDQDKSESLYLILRAMNAQRIFEAGTSFGVSTMYLIAAMRDNIQQNGIKEYSQKEITPKVWGTEMELSKAKIAKENFQKAFQRNEEWEEIIKNDQFKLLQGDIIEKITKESIFPASIDCILLDIWAPVALPTMIALNKALKPGTTLFIDNSNPTNERYAQLHEYLDNPSNKWKSTILPFDNGFEMAVKM